MNRLRKAGLIVATAMMFGSLATAQTAKELKVQSGKSVVVANLLSTRPDCSSDPGRMAVPVVREKPSNGMIQMQILLTNVEAAGNCSARRIPSLGLIYTPSKGFTGTDTVEVEVDEGNKATILSFRITVEPANGDERL
jgi:hypothetical protein